MKILAAVEYERLKEIGGQQGRQSKVWLASDPQLGGELVVKEIPRSRITDPDKYFEEAQKLFSSAHERVVPIQWAAISADHICLAMPLMPGGSLTDKIAVRPLPATEAIKMGIDVCAGVSRLHAAGLLHLDIKPTNILFDAVGRPAVTDFGQAVSFDPATGTADVTSHPMYILFTPPERYLTGLVTAASDVYQLGLTLSRAVNGENWYRRQIEGRSRFELVEMIKDGSFPSKEFLAHVPADLANVLRRATALDPAERFQTAQELALALAKVRVPIDWHVEKDTPTETTWRLKRSGRPDLVIDRIGIPPDAAVEIWTVGKSGRRRKQVGAWAQRVSTDHKLAIALRRAFRAALS